MRTIAAWILPWLPALAWAQDPPASKHPEGGDALDVDALIDQLDSDDGTARERASEELARVGVQAAKALQRAAREHRSPEVRARAAAILDALDGGGPAVNGLKVFLSADRTSAQPGDRIVFITRIVNRTPETMNLYIGYSTGGPDFESGRALRSSPGGSGRSTAVGFCGVSARPLFVTIPAGGEARFEAPATLGVDNGRPFLAFRWYRIDLDDASEVRFWLEHSVDSRQNSDQRQRVRRELENSSPYCYWTGEIKSNVVKLRIEREGR